MVNKKTFIMFAAVEADSAKVAEELLSHPTQGLKLIVSANKEIVQGFLTSRNNDSQQPSCIGFEFKVSEITQM